MRALAAIVALSGLALPLAGAEPGRAIDRLEELSRRIREHPVWQAEYEQEYRPAGMLGGEQVAGTLWVAYPDRVLFRSGEEATRSMGLEGRRVRLVDRAAATCDEHVLDDEEWSRVPLVAVLDPQASLEQFTVLELGESGITLVPRRPGGVAQVDVVLADGLPEEIVVVDPQGSSNRLRFSAWRAVERAPAGGWLPSPPRGVDCIDDAP